MRKLVGNPAIAVAYTRGDEAARALQTAAIDAWQAKRCMRVAAWASDDGDPLLGAAHPGLEEALHAVRTHAAGIFVVHAPDDVLGPLAPSVVAAALQLGALVRSTAPMVSLATRLKRGVTMRAVVADLRAKGRRFGIVPFGFRVVRCSLVEDEAEQRVIGQARALRARGVSYRAIAEALTLAGFRSRGGKPFVHHQVQRMLDRNPVAVVGGRRDTPAPDDA